MKVHTLRTQRIVLTADDIAALAQQRFDLPNGQAMLTDRLNDEVQEITLVIHSTDEREI